MSQNMKVKIKQFQWFQMQTKVRQIIQQVLGPIQKRILQTSSILNKVKTNQVQDQNRIQQISLMIANDPNVFQTGVFASVDKKFQQHAKLIQQLNRQIEQQNKYVENKFKILDLRMQQSSQVLKNIASLKQRVCRQMEIQNDNINSVRKNIQVMIQDLNQDLRDTRKNIVDNHQLSEKRDCLIQEQIRRIKQNILTIQDNINLHRDMHQQKNTTIEDHSKSIEKFSKDIIDLFDNKRLTKKLCDLVEDMQIDIKKTIFKVQAINPLITQAQISECLSSILPPKLKNKICIFDYKKYFHLNKQVLQKDFRTISLKFNGVQLLQNMQKKSTKQIVQLKRRKLLQMGIDIDHVSYEQRQKYYQQINLQDELNMDYEENKVTQKIDQGQVKRILSGFMHQYLSEFKEKIKIQIQDNKKYIYGIEEQVRYQISGFQNKINTIKNKSNTFQVQNTLQIKNNLNLINQVSQNVIKFNQKLKQTHDLQRLFYNFCSLVNHLAIQDQIDKQNISLLGARQVSADNVNQNTKQINSIVALDDKCFSCNGYPATTLSAFKMACLAYHPSPIKIDSKNYKRQELLQFTTNMLQSIKRLIQNVHTPNSQQASQQQLVNNNNNNDNKKQIGKSKYKLDNTIRFDTFHEEQTPNKKQTFKNLMISKHISTEQINNESEIKQKNQSISISKFRTKKNLNSTMSTSCYGSKNKSLSLKKQISINQELINTTVIFNALKRKNHSFLN